MKNPNDTLGGARITSPTADTRGPWQEVLSRLSTIPANKVIEAAAVIQGISGSWTGSYVQGVGILTDNMNEIVGAPSPTQFVPYLLGQPGMPEINFPPYAAHTNRMGSKGGALIGHPISFSIVGPTAANRLTNWQWLVTDNSAVPGTGDVLTLDSVEAVSELLTIPPTTPGAFSRTLGDLYGITDLADYPGGLYVYVTQTASGTALAGTTLSGTGGLRDGLCNGTGSRTAIIPNSALSKGEIFRVVSIDAGLTALTLDPAKRLADYFVIPSGAFVPVVRSINIVKPEAARCIGAPDSGSTPAAPKTFVMVPPARALNADRQYPLDRWTGATFQEDLVPFVSDGTIPGVANEYALMPKLPVPRPIASVAGRLCGEVGDAVPFDVGPARMKVILEDDGAGVWVGRVINIREISVLGGAQLVIDGASGWQADLKTVTGWFYVTGFVAPVSPTSSIYGVCRIDEWNPVTGQSYWGPSLAYELDQTAIVTGDGIHFKVSIHEPIESLWMTPYLDWDALDSARLTNIIDPEWAERGLNSTNPPGVSVTRPDRVAFGTASDGTHFANPGNLFDLGFRVVLYPAMSNGGETIPDFNRPVDSNEVLLDPTANRSEKQWVEIDYSNGIIRLSHAPAVGGSLWPTDAGVFTNTDNPRHEVVIFASCVPYSMEEGQTGTGIRVSGSLTDTAPDRSCLSEAERQTDHADVYGSRLIFPVADQTIRSTTQGAVGGYTIKLTGTCASQIPQAGFVELLQGDMDPFGAPIFSDIKVRASTWGYLGVSEAAGYTYLHNIFGGARATIDNYVVAVAPAPPAVPTPVTAVFRREITTPSDAYGRTLVDYQHDTTYGRAKRSQTLRFEDAEVSANLDGSASIRSRQTLAKSHEALFSDLFSSWVLEGGLVTAVLNGGSVDVSWTAMTILYKGQRISLPAGVLSFVDAPSYNEYIYVSATPEAGTGCHPVLVVSSLPLPDPDDVLLALVLRVSGVPVVTDLRYVLKDVDQRMNIYVGMGEGTESSTPHFDNLADAVAYANEIQNPTSGTPGRRCHIQVVGYTEEDDTKLPIMIKTDGLVITGSPRVTTGVDKVAISWASETKHLIDLNGHSDLEFDLLSFQCDAVTTPMAIQRCVFTDTSLNGLYRVRITNCRSLGKAQGFFYRDISGNVACEDIWITGNYAHDLLDLGVYFGTSQHSLPDRVHVRDNSFFQNGTPGLATLTHRSGVGFFTDYEADPFGDAVDISGNTINGFLRGIYSGPMMGSLIQNNTVTGTYNEGILAEGWKNSSINQNHLSGIWTETGSSFAVGLHLNSILIGITISTPIFVQLTGNDVSLLATGVGAGFRGGIRVYGKGLNLDSNSTGPTDEIWVFGTVISIDPPNTSKGDSAASLKVEANHTKVFGFHGVNNTVSTIDIYNATDTEFHGCEVWTLETKNPIVFPTVSDRGVIVGGSYTNLKVYSSDWLVSGCAVSSSAELGYNVLTTTQYGTGIRASDCLFWEVFLGLGTSVDSCNVSTRAFVAQDSLVSNSYIVGLQNYVSGTADHCQFTGNNIVLGSAGDGTFYCTHCIWTGNNLGTLGTTIALIPQLAGTSTNNQFVGNYFNAGVLGTTILGAAGIPMTNSIIADNRFHGDVDVSGCSGLVIQGNIITGSLLPAAGDPDANGTLVVCNCVKTAIFNVAPLASPGSYANTTTWGYNRSQA